MKFRTLHRTLGILIFLFLINAATTGVMRANAKWWYWKDSKSAQKETALALPAAGLDKIFAVFSEKSPEWKISKLQLKRVLDRQVYLLETTDPANKYMLLDAESAAILSPITQAMAEAVAQKSASQESKIISAELLPLYQARKSSPLRPVYDVRFDDREKSEVFVDRDTAEAVWTLNRGKRLGLWVNRMHELDFAGLSRWLLLILGSAIVFLSLTGLILAFPKFFTKLNR